MLDSNFAIVAHIKRLKLKKLKHEFTNCKPNIKNWMRHKYTKFSELKEQKILIPNLIKQKHIKHFKYQFFNDVIKLHNEKIQIIHYIKSKIRICFKVD